MVPTWSQDGPSSRQNGFMAAQVHDKVALSESKLVQRWAKLSSRQFKVSPTCPQVGPNCFQIASRWLQYCMKAERPEMLEKQMKTDDFSCFLCLSWCHYVPKFIQVGCNLAQVGSKASREGSSWHKDIPSWCQHGFKMAQVDAKMAAWQPKCTRKGH